jgi:hypothetical protein
MGQLGLAMGIPARSAALLRALDKDIVPPDQPVGRGLLLTTLAVETVMFLWMSLGLTVPWAIALPPALLVVATLSLELARTRRGARGNRPRLLVAALTVTLVLDALLVTFLALLLLLVLVQGSLAGNGIVPLLIMPFILGIAIYMRTALPLLLVLMLVLILDLGVLMDTGPIVFLAAPLVAAVGVVVVLFQTVSFQTVSFGPSSVVMDRVMAGAGRVSHS